MQPYASLLIVNMVLVTLFFRIIVLRLRKTSTMNYRICQCIKKTELF